MRQRRETVEHPFGTIKSWMRSTQFRIKTLKRVGADLALHVLAYNLKRVMAILGIGPRGAGVKSNITTWSQRAMTPRQRVGTML